MLINLAKAAFEHAGWPTTINTGRYVSLREQLQECGACWGKEAYRKQVDMKDCGKVGESLFAKNLQHISSGSRSESNCHTLLPSKQH